MIVGDLNEDRLAQAKSFGCETVNVQKHDRLGFEASGHGNQGEAPAAVLNSIMDVTQVGGALAFQAYT